LKYLSSSAIYFAILSALELLYRSAPTTKENSLLFSKDFTSCSSSSSPIFVSADIFPISSSSKSSLISEGRFYLSIEYMLKVL